jgi:hypothetical protein
MAKRADRWFPGSDGPSGYMPKRAKSHRVSESEDDGDSDQGSMSAHFNDPKAFMRNFGGYDSDNDDDQDSDDQGIYLEERL